MIEVQYARLLKLMQFVFDGLPGDFPLSLQGVDFSHLPRKEKLVPLFLSTVEQALVKIKALQGVVASYTGDYKHKEAMFRLVWSLSYCWAELAPLLEELAEDNHAAPLKNDLDSPAALRLFLEQLKAFPTEVSALPVHMVQLFQKIFAGQPVSALWDPALHARAMSTPQLVPAPAPAEPLTPMAALDDVASAPRSEEQASSAAAAASVATAPAETLPSAEVLAAELEEYGTRRLSNLFGWRRHNIPQARDLAEQLRRGEITVAQLAAHKDGLLRDAEPTGGYARVLGLLPSVPPSQAVAAAAPADSSAAAAYAPVLQKPPRPRSEGKAPVTALAVMRMGSSAS